MVDLEVNDFWVASLLGGIFLDAVVFMKEEPDFEVQGALQSTASTLSALTRDIEAINKAITDSL